ncbi:MAG TPA: AAA family ATPase [Pseudonocardiaceae bacterium]|nr:AAA family ATPase [Pseudonocardiaceae bacterium]
MGDKFIFETEQLLRPHGTGREFQAETIGVGGDESGLAASAMRERPAVAYVRELLAACKVYHFHDTSQNAAVKQFAPTADNIALRGDAGNLAAVLLSLRDSDRPAYQRITRAVTQVAPFFRDFVLEPENDSIRLRWRQRDSSVVFSADQLSDGTLRFICLATLLLQPTMPKLVVLDEPELGLHPYAIVQLADLLRQAATRSQVVLATQSVTLINQFELADLIVVEGGKDGSTFERPSGERLGAWLDEYSLGDLWEKNLIGGRPGNPGKGTR